MINYSIIPLFSTPVYISEILIDTKDILKYSEIIKYDLYSNKTGYISRDNKILNQKIFLPLEKLIKSHLDNYLYNHLKVNNISLKHSCSWINRYEKGHYAEPHFHSNSTFSGVFYLKVPSGDCGSIVFEQSAYIPTINTVSFDIKFSENTIHNAKVWEVKPKQNLILIFPSHLTHRITHNNTNDVRYSLAFNYFISGRVGQDATMLDLKVI